ncbi:MAG: ChaN family lipoprotein [Flavobacteriales bacterium]|jgi:uncharacterized iron-regulated protein|nr:ChaN family lipoprotein [Flavobacteriales bacterium]
MDQHSLYRKTRTLVMTIAAFTWGMGNAQVLPAYALFNAEGKSISHKKFLHAVDDADVILFGEQHNNSIAHWLELVVARDLAARGPLVLGAEMIEADDQNALDRYLRGEIDQDAFDTLTRLWPNYASDYAPLVDLAKEKGLPFIATNVPRRYARAVSKGGFEALDTVPEAERQWIAPLPIDFDASLPQYVNMLTMLGDHGTPDVVKAQALKDATMAWSIAQHVRKGVRFLHFNGSYHSDFHAGIMWYLQRSQPDLKVVTIATVVQGQVAKLDAEHRGQADVILCVDADIPGSY